ncbi:MAG TPA: heme exporter protein CcmB [Bryobacteraceae bacterium]|nr:heme exporter protein CcmB [Bryobacteraceae bacterium]
MKRDLLSALFIARKDLRTEFRTKEALNAAVSFALVVLVLFSFAFDLERDELYDISGGLLWIVYVFAGSLIVNRSFTREVPNDCLDVLVASPVPAWALFLGKAISSFTLLMVVELVSLPFYGLFNNIIWLKTFWPHFGLMLLATWGITVTGVAFSAVTVNVRLRELMLPVLHYPLLIPLLIGAMEMSTSLLRGDVVNNEPNLRLVAVFDAIFTALSLYLIEFILVT